MSSHPIGRVPTMGARSTRRMRVVDIIDPEALVIGNPTGLFGILWGTGGLWLLIAAALGAYDAGMPVVPATVGTVAVVIGSLLVRHRRTAMPTWANVVLTLVGSTAVTIAVVGGGPVGGTAAGTLYVYATTFARTATPGVAGLVVAASAAMHLFALLVIERPDALSIWAMTWGVATIVGLLAGAVVDQLARNAARLRQADQAKDRLLAVVSHELRTPLTAVIGATDTLMSDRADRLSDAQRADLLAMARRQAHRQLGLVEDLLTLSLEANHRTATSTTVDPSEAVVRAASALPIDVGLDLDPTAPLVICEPDHLERIVSNLVVNADRYGRPPLHVRTRADDEDGTVLVEVVDHGVGIEGGLSSRLFEAFVTGGNGGVDTGGVGLGLSICSQLAVANGGHLTYEPTPGGGATIGVRLRAA